MSEYDSTECSKEHRNIADHLKRFERALEVHIAETHAMIPTLDNVMTKADVVASDSRIEAKINEFNDESEIDRVDMHRQLDEMGEVVLGQKHVDFDGNIVRSGGMKAMVAENENGGLKFKYTNLVVSTLGVVLVALIGLFGTILQHQHANSTTNEQIVEQVEDNTNRLRTIIKELEQIVP